MVIQAFRDPDDKHINLNPVTSGQSKQNEPEYFGDEFIIKALQNKFSRKMERVYM